MPHIPPNRSPSASEQPGADVKWPPTDDELTQYGIEIAESKKSEQSDTAREGSGPGKWAAEMVRVQALIERLTDPLEWRTFES